MKIIGNKRLYLLIAIVIVVSVTVFAGVISTANNTTKEPIKDTGKAGIENCLEGSRTMLLQAGAFQDTEKLAISKDNYVSNSKDTLSNIENAKAQYSNDLYKFYAKDSDIAQKALDSNNKILSEFEEADSTPIYDLTLDAGILQSKIQSTKPNEGFTDVQWELIVWSKYIMQREDTGEYNAYLSLNKEISTDRLILENGAYKHYENLDSQLIFNEDSEGELIGTYKTINEAIKALEEIKPTDKMFQE